MATVNFIRYKTQSAGALKGVAEYVAQKEKTWDKDSDRQLVSGQNCTPQFACREFLATRSAWHKGSPVWFYHYTQSFHPDENVDGPTAHKLAQEFAARAWPDSEVLIATHVDVDHIHSHFVINAVCHETGKMLRQGPGTLARLRGLSDELCHAYGLSTLPSQEAKTQGMTGREYRSAAKGESWKFQTMNAIDQCMRLAANKDDFIQKIEHLGYRVRWENGRQNITYTHPNGKKIRDRKLHEEKYLKERMEREFYIRRQILLRGIEAAQLAARSADADRDSAADGDTSNRGRVAGAAPDPVDDGRDAWNTDRTHRGDITVSPIALPVGTAGNAKQGNDIRPEAAGTGAHGDNSDPNAAGTGWEEERKAFLDSLAQHPLGTVPTGMVVPAVGLSLAVGGAALLGAGMEQLERPVFVTHPHSDRKALQREREKKIAMGHKPDDREKQITEQTL